MGLFSRKKKSEKEEEVRKPVDSFDRSVYVQTSTQKTAGKKTDSKKTKGEKTMAEKKTAEKKPAAKPAAKKETAAKKTETKKAAAKPAAEKTTAAKPAAKTAAKPAAKKETAAKKEPAKKPAAKAAAPKEKKVWHITKRDDENKWQVKCEGNSKATKLFNTKKEAEEYVKSLTANNEGSRVVAHKKDGKFQKK